MNQDDPVGEGASQDEGSAAELKKMWDKIVLNATYPIKHPIFQSNPCSEVVKDTPFEGACVPVSSFFEEYVTRYEAEFTPPALHEEISISINGPVGSGKSTIGLFIAKALADAGMTVMLDRMLTENSTFIRDRKAVDENFKRLAERYKELNGYIALGEKQVYKGHRGSPLKSASDLELFRKSPDI